MGLTTKYQQALSSLNEIHCENCEVDKVQAFFRRGSFISILIPLIANQQKEVGGGGLVQAGKKIACLLFACGIREGRDKNVTCQSDKKRKKGSTATEGSVNLPSQENLLPALEFELFGLTVDFGGVYWQHRKWGLVIFNREKFVEKKARAMYGS